MGRDEIVPTYRIPGTGSRTARLGGWPQKSGARTGPSQSPDVRPSAYPSRQSQGASVLR